MSFYITGVGACVADWQELDPALMKKAHVYADTKEAALKESGDIILSGVSIDDWLIDWLMIG